MFKKEVQNLKNTIIQDLNEYKNTFEIVFENKKHLKTFRQKVKVDFEIKYEKFLSSKLKLNPKGNLNLNILRKSFVNSTYEKSKAYSHASDLLTNCDIENLLDKLPIDIKKSLNRLTVNLTNQDKYVVIKKAVDQYNLNINKDFIFAEIAQLLYFVYKSYQNPREYLDVNSRIFIEDKIKEFINKFSSNNFKFNSYLHLISIDVNGLKTVNDYGVSKSHFDGNKLLLAFTHILQKGKTTKLLEKKNIEVHVAAQAGDEYLILLVSKVNLDFMQKEIEALYLSELLDVKKLTITRKIRRPNGTITNYKKEFGEIDIENIIDYSTQEIKDLFKSKNINFDPNQRFMLTCSFGWSSFDEVIKSISLSPNKSYLALRKQIQDKIIQISDQKSIINKRLLKEHLKKIGLLQYHALLTVRSDTQDMLDLQEENQKLKEKILELEKRLNQ